MKIFDSHSHIDDKSYNNDRDEVIKRAKTAGVEKIMVVGITERTSRKALEIAKAYPNIYASVGIHPHDAKEYSDAALNALKNLAKDPKVRAWGETGLDFNRMFSPQNTQEKCFARQMEIAEELDLPLIFHERDSKGRFLEMLKYHHTDKRRGVVHCFSGNQSQLKAYLELGYYIGITGIVTIQERGEILRRLIPMIPIDRLLGETDAPYLTPAPEKNKTRRNEPAFVKSVLLKVAQVRGEDKEMLANQVWENTCALFGIEE